MRDLVIAFAWRGESPSGKPTRVMRSSTVRRFWIYFTGKSNSDIKRIPRLLDSVRSRATIK